MRNGRPCVCSFVPPHILRHIAEKGDARQRDLAHAALEIADGVRAERRLVANFVSALALSASGKRRTVYDALHGKTLPGRLIRGESDRPTRDVAANEAFDGSGITYDFYRKVLDRDSIDGRGMRLDSSVHFGKDYNNAQWNGRQMIYGDGDGKIFNRFTQALDVIGHELTHGVTQHESGLIYEGQSGALNESISDCFGAAFAQWLANKPASDASGWLIGAGIMGPQAKAKGFTCLRDMVNPGATHCLSRQPASYKDFDPTGDVHDNSGIPNRAFAAFAQNLGGNTYDMAIKVWYDACMSGLSSRATFADFAKATVAAAQKKSPAVATAATDAWHTVDLPVGSPDTALAA